MKDKPPRRRIEILKFGFLIYLLLVFAKSSASADDAHNKSNLSSVEAMQNVLDEDQRLAAVTSNSIAILDQNTDEGMDKIASVIREYLSQARQINLKSCPGDFARAYVRNLAANESLADVTAEHPHLPKNGINALAEYDQTKFQEGPDAWLHRYDDAGANVLKTWIDVTNLFDAYKQGRPPKALDDPTVNLNTPTITNLVVHCSNGAFHDTVSVLNSSGQDLTRVLVSIEVTNDQGDKRRVHGEYYWESWKSGETKKIGIAETLYNVTTASLSGDCDQGSIGSGPRHAR